MYLSNNKKFKYKKWAKSIGNNSLLFSRGCISHPRDVFDAFIFKEKNLDYKKYRCEVPILFKTNKSIAVEDLYIKQIKHFNTLEEAAMWIDLHLIKNLNSILKAPFYFFWFKEESNEKHVR